MAESGMDNPHWHPWSRIQVQVQGLTNDPKKGKGHGSEERKETGEGIHEDRGASQVLLGALPKERRHEEELRKCVLATPRGDS